METVIVSEVWRSKTVILTDDDVSDGRACVELFIRDMEDAKALVAYTPQEAIELARALLTAAGEPTEAAYPGATSKIVPNRVVEPQHMFEIGDYVQIKDDIRGHIVDFQDAEAIVKGDIGQLVGAYIGDIEYIGDERPSVDETAR